MVSHEWITVRKLSCSFVELLKVQHLPTCLLFSSHVPLPLLPPHFSPTVRLHPRSPLCFRFFLCFSVCAGSSSTPPFLLTVLSQLTVLSFSLSPALPPVQVHRTEWLATLRLPPSPHSEYYHANFTDRHRVENFRGRGLLFPRSALICFGGGQSNVWCMRGKKGKNGDGMRRREQFWELSFVRLTHLWTGAVKVVLCLCGNIEHGWKGA